MVILKSLILKGNKSVLHLLRDLVKVNPYTVFLSVQTQNLYLFSGRILGIEEGCLVLVVPCALKIDYRIACNNRDCVDKNVADADYESKAEDSEQRNKESACV